MAMLPLSAVSMCRRTAGRHGARPRSNASRRTTAAGWLSWSSSCAASTRRSASRRAAATSVVPCGRLLAGRHVRAPGRTGSSWAVARASGVLAKNDPRCPHDRVFIAIMPTRPAQPHAPAVERLAEILTVRRQLSDAKSPLKMPPDCWKMRCCSVFPAAASLGSPPISPARWALGRDRRGRCRARSPLPAAHLHAGGRPGPGLHADCALARLGRMNRKQAAALVGLAPYAFDSGNSRSALYLGRSRVHPTRALHGGSDRHASIRVSSIIASRQPERSRRSSSWR